MMFTYRGLLGGSGFAALVDGIGGIHPQFGAPPSNMIRGGVAGYGHVAYLGMRSMAKIAIDVRSAQEWKRPLRHPLGNPLGTTSTWQTGYR